MKDAMDRLRLCVVGSVRRAGSRSRATSITDRVKTLDIEVLDGLVQDVVVRTHSHASVQYQTFRSHNYITENGRLYDRNRNS